LKLERPLFYVLLLTEYCVLDILCRKGQTKHSLDGAVSYGVEWDFHWQNDVWLLPKNTYTEFHENLAEPSVTDNTPARQEDKDGRGLHKSVIIYFIKNS